MKKRILSFSTALIGLAVVLTSYSNGPSTSGNGNRTGTGASPTIGCATPGGCHSAPDTKTTATIGIFDGTTSVLKFIPGKQYTIKIDGSNADNVHPKFGFQFSSVKSSSLTTQAGVLATGGTPNIGTTTIAGVQLMESKASLTATTAGGFNIYNTTFKWTAPTTAIDTVRFYLVLNSVNANNIADAGDHYYNTAFEITKQSVGIDDLHCPLSLQLHPNPASNAVNLRLNLAEATSVTASVYGMTGCKAQTEIFDAAAGAVNHSIQVAALPAGQYLLSVMTAKGGKQIVPFTKL